MTTAVQHRRGTTAEHSTFTGLEGEVTIDTTKDTAVIHDGVLAGGVPLARENLANVTPSGLATITGASTASDDKFFIYDQSATTLKSITRAELNNAMEIDALANVTITGGTINGTTIGASTAAAGTFTSLTATSANVTGTVVADGLTVDGTLGSFAVDAQGVIASFSRPSTSYIRATNAAGQLRIDTGGSVGRALFAANGDISFYDSAGSSQAFFWDASKESLSIGTVGAYAKLSVLSAGTGAFPTTGLVQVDDNNTPIVAWNTDDTATYSAIRLETRSTAASVWQIANEWKSSFLGDFVFRRRTGSATSAEAMRITSAGSVGIGTSTPAAKLHVSGSFGSQFRLQETGGTYFDIAVGGRFDLKNAAGTTIVSIAQGGSPVGTQLNLDSSGNLGLGVTPSAWGSNYKAIQLGTQTALYNAVGYVTSLNTNAYENSSGELRRIAAGEATRYVQAGGAHQWFSAANGSANAIASFTQAMTLDAGGNLLVGGTSAKGQITSIKSSSTTTFSSLGHGMLGLQNTSSTNNNYTWMNFYESNGNYVGAIGTLNEVHSSASNTVKGSLVFATKQSGVGGYPVERARIDSAGNLGLNVTSNPNLSRLIVKGRGTYSTNTTFTQANSTVQIISDEMTVNGLWYPTFNIAMVRQSLTTGSTAFGGIGFSTIDDSNSAGMHDAGRIAIVNEIGSQVASGTAMAFYTQAGSTTQTNPAEERVRITKAGDLLAGTTSTSGSTTNYARIVGGVFSSLKGDLGSLATNTFYTLFDAGAAYSCYLVTVIGIAADAVNYSATAVVNIQNTSVSISYIDAGGLIFITNSGTAIRVNQNSGGTMGSLHWTALKIA